MNTDIHKFASELFSRRENEIDNLARLQEDYKKRIGREDSTINLKLKVVTESLDRVRKAYNLYITIMKVTDAQICIVNSNKRVDLVHDPVYLLTRDPLFQRMMMARRMPESIYWEIVFGPTNVALAESYLNIANSLWKLAHHENEKRIIAHLPFSLASHYRENKQLPDLKQYGFHPDGLPLLELILLDGARYAKELLEKEYRHIAEQEHNRNQLSVILTRRRNSSPHGERTEPLEYWDNIVRLYEDGEEQS